MSRDRDAGLQERVRHEYINGPAPFALPEQEQVGEEPGPSPKRRRPTRRPATSLRALATVGLTIAFGVTIGGSIVISGDPRQKLVDDRFDRVVNGKWGRADSGQPWAHSPYSEGGLAVRPVGGIMELTQPGRWEHAIIRGAVSRDVNVAVNFSMNRNPGGNGTRVVLLARRNKAGAYRGRIRVGSDGAVYVSFWKMHWGKVSQVGGRHRVPGLVARPRQQIHARMQVIQANPTQLRMRVWSGSQPEPRGWHIVKNDAGVDDLEGRGLIGFDPP